MQRHSRRGFSLLEPVIALAVLGLAGAGWIGVLAQARATGAAVNRAEREYRGAATVMAGLAREAREALVLRAGRHTVGEYEVIVSQRDEELFDVQISLLESGALLLTTTLLRQREAAGAK